MQPLFIFKSYSNVKSVFTAGADNGVLSLLLWKAKIVFAGRTFSVNVSFSVTALAFLKVEKFSRPFDKLQKRQIFLLPFVYVL